MAEVTVAVAAMLMNEAAFAAVKTSCHVTEVLTNSYQWSLPPEALVHWVGAAMAPVAQARPAASARVLSFMGSLCSFCLDGGAGAVAGRCFGTCHRMLGAFTRHGIAHMDYGNVILGQRAAGVQAFASVGAAASEAA